MCVAHRVFRPRDELENADGVDEATLEERRVGIDRDAGGSERAIDPVHGARDERVVARRRRSCGPRRRRPNAWPSGCRASESRSRARGCGRTQERVGRRRLELLRHRELRREMRECARHALERRDRRCPHRSLEQRVGAQIGERGPRNGSSPPCRSSPIDPNVTSSSSPSGIAPAPAQR